MHFTTPQYRMMKRILNHEKLPLSAYRDEHATVAALVRKNAIHKGDVHWLATWKGSDAILSRAKKFKAQERQPKTDE